MFQWIDKMAFKSRGGQVDAYPFDFDGSLRNTRPASGIDYFPHHSNVDNFAKLGCVSGFLPQQDNAVWGMGYAKTPFGPMTDFLPINLQNSITVPGLTKQLPQY
jgi:hypothetical protein